jgi:hypothetical protein
MFMMYVYKCEHIRDHIYAHAVRADGLDLKRKGREKGEP